MPRHLPAARDLEGCVAVVQEGHIGRPQRGGDRGEYNQDRAPARKAGPKRKPGKGAQEDFSRGPEFDDEIPF